MTKKATELRVNYIPFIPQFVFDTTLSPTDLRVYLYILYKWRVYNYSGGEFIESVATIAQALNCASRSVNTSLGKLKAKKILDIQNRIKDNKQKDTSIITPLNVDGSKMSGVNKTNRLNTEIEGKLPF